MSELLTLKEHYMFLQKYEAIWTYPEADGAITIHVEGFKNVVSI